jgi:hypothetical protein
MHRTTEVGTRHPASGACSPVGEIGWAAANYPLGAHVNPSLTAVSLKIALLPVFRM